MLFESLSIEHTFSLIWYELAYVFSPHPTHTALEFTLALGSQPLWVLQLH